MQVLDLFGSSFDPFEKLHIRDQVAANPSSDARKLCAEAVFGRTSPPAHLP